MGNAYAQRARMTLLPVPGAKPWPFGNEEFFVVDLEKNYSKEWPSVRPGPNGTLVFSRGFLEPLDDPDAPFFFLYRCARMHGLESAQSTHSEVPMLSTCKRCMACMHVHAMCAVHACRHSEPPPSVTK